MSKRDMSRRGHRMCVIGPGLVAVLALCAGCVGGGGGSGGGSGNSPDGGVGSACEAVGPAQQLPAAARFGLASGADGFVLVMEDGGFGSEQWSTWVLGEGEPFRSDANLGSGPVAVAGNGAEAVGFGVGMLAERIRVRRWDGMTWVEGESVEPLGDRPISARAVATAVSSGGLVAVGWLTSDPFVEGPSTTVWVSAVPPGGGPSAREAVFTPDDEVLPSSIHLGADAAGGVHVLAHGDGEPDNVLIYRHRAPSGEWGPVVVVGPTPGILSSATTSALAVTESGDVFVAEAHEANFVTGAAGATVVYRVEEDGPRRVGEISDARPVVGGLAMAPLAGGVALAVTYGQNNPDPAASEDSVEMFVCGDGACGGRAAVTAVPGVFYESVALAARGSNVTLVWQQSPKRDTDAPEANLVQRFECP